MADIAQISVNLLLPPLYWRFYRKFVINSPHGGSIDARSHRHLFAKLSFLLIRRITKYRV